jgi:hypothetical protein
MDVLVLDASLAAGCYLVSGRSRTVWVLDWRPPMPAYVVRLRGEDSPADSSDSRWVRLLEVASVDPETGAIEPGVVRVGRRHRWTTNPGARTEHPESWVVQSRCTAVEPVSRDRLGRLLAAADAARVTGPSDPRWSAARVDPAG